MRVRSKAIGLLFGVALSVASAGRVSAQQIAALPPQPPAAVAPQIPMFGTREIHYFGLSPFTRWSTLLVRWQREREDAAESCLSSHSTAPPCPPREWIELIARFRHRPLSEQVDGINAAINAHPYISALDNWGDPSHWETPFEFFRRNGQCQDYAITKFLLLRELGVPDQAMRLVVLRDVRRQVDHAVLVVDVSGRELMLDNLARTVVLASSNPNYHAYYSINESGWWLHLPNPLMPTAYSHEVASR